MKNTKKTLLNAVAAEISFTNRAAAVRNRINYLITEAVGTDASPETMKAARLVDKYYFTRKNSDLVKLIAFLES
jgi:hypothetical protein